MKRTINQSHIEGYIYEHTLELRESGPDSKNPGTIFIRGELNIATDNECTNIVPVFFKYVTEKTTKGNKNATFGVLKNIIDGKYGTIMKDGKENAIKIRVDSAIGLREFYAGADLEELVSVKRNDGGFVHVVEHLVEDEKVRNTFKCDMLITNVKEIEPNEEMNLPAKAIIKGAIFDWRGALLPVEFSAVNPNAINYFLSLDASNSNPTFTCVWGRQVSETIKKEIKTESAFGEDEVRIVERKKKDFVITGSLREPYLWDDESTLTAVELTEKIAARETYLAAEKQRQMEQNANKATASIASVIPSNSGFNF